MQGFCFKKYTTALILTTCIYIAKLKTYVALSCVIVPLENKMLAAAKSVLTTATRYTYAQASKEVQRLGLVGEKQYLEFAKRDPRLPLNPRGFYSNKGWGGWMPFLGIHYFSYDQAVARLKELGVLDQRTYYLFDSDFRLHRNPDIFYANKGWKSWASFFGKVNRSATNKYVFYSYFETVSKVRECRITSLHQYRQLCQVDILLPTHPENTYRDKGWISWDVFWSEK